MGAAVSAGVGNDELVDNLMEANYIKTAAIERVFRAVDRGHYFTVECKDNAYKDLAWRNGNLHISAPCIYSEVMENLKLAPGMSFLNLGSGTGYLSTMAGLILVESPGTPYLKVTTLTLDKTEYGIGSYGINHGVEIHEDVINYAKKKLEEFCLTSPALDEYEFCQPKFVNGDCLHLGSRQYDRVYCGAACPENQENYMKNLIKVGGILVMPINDQLLQIYRISDTNWESKPILPVSFASLICSNASGGSEPLKMPDADPLTLQDICRFAVRSILRRKIDMEHPELKKKPAQAPTKRVPKMTLRKFVIPIFGGHSDSEDNDLETEDHTAVRDFGRSGFIMDVPSVRSCRTLLELGHFLPGPSRRSESSGEQGDDEEGHNNKDGRRIDDENMADKDMPSQEEYMSDSESNYTSKTEKADDSARSDVEMTEAPERLSEPADALVNQRNKIKDGKREKFDSGIVEDIEKGMSSDSDNEIDCEPVNGKDSQRSYNFFVNFEDSDTETAVSENSSGKTDDGKNTDKNETAENSKNYSLYMREKIKMLPLPMTLKYFVNFDREL